MIEIYKITLNDPPLRATPGLVRHQDNSIAIIFRPNEDPYIIEHSRINTSEKLLGWVYHLSKKSYITNDHIKALIEAAHDLGVRVDFGA